MPDHPQSPASRPAAPTPGTGRGSTPEAAGPDSWSELWATAGPLRAQVREGATRYARHLARLAWDAVVPGPGEPSESADVYTVIAEQVAHLAGQPAAAAMAAIAQLCPDEDAQALAAGLPPAPAGLVERLRNHLVWITVSYQMPPKAESQRVIQITHRPGTGSDVLALKIAEQLAWDDVPAAARARALGDNVHEITYQIYPQRDAAPGPAAPAPSPRSAWTE
jgi:hypothetical protein